MAFQVAPLFPAYNNDRIKKRELFSVHILKVFGEPYR